MSRAGTILMFLAGHFLLIGPMHARGSEPKQRSRIAATLFPNLPLSSHMRQDSRSQNNRDAMIIEANRRASQLLRGGLPLKDTRSIAVPGLGNAQPYLAREERQSGVVSRRIRPVQSPVQLSRSERTPPPVHWLPDVKKGAKSHRKAYRQLVRQAGALLDEGYHSQAELILTNATSMEKDAQPWVIAKANRLWQKLDDVREQEEVASQKQAATEMMQKAERLLESDQVSDAVRLALRAKHFPVSYFAGTMTPDAVLLEVARRDLAEHYGVR